MGYDVKKVVGGLQKDLQCCKCKQILEDPVKTACGHICCRQCLQIDVKRKASHCSTCRTEIEENTKEKVEKELLNKLEKVTLKCILGCESVMLLGQMQKHVKTQCQLRVIACVNRGCSFQCPIADLEKHLPECEFRLVQCDVCKACVSHHDMPTHQAVKKCYQQKLKSKRVASARKLSSELKDHRLGLQQQKHSIDQEERRLIKDHYEKQKSEYFIHRHRAQSASAVLTKSIQTRVGSALVVPRYSRTLSQTTPLSCYTCENKFLSGRRPSARRHSHSKVCG